MNKRERLEAAGILRPANEVPYTPEEEVVVESLTEPEMDLIINQGQNINEVIDEHEPEIERIAAGHLADL